MSKNLIKFKEFNPFKKKLEGQYLIEASAGTGKTFTIIILYLRMLLGLYKKNNNTLPLPLTVEQILVVTFTDTATQDLCKRIKNSIHILRKGCLKKKSKYKIINNFIKKIKNHKIASDLLLKAELNMHNASIYTIHSFCKKILNFKNYEIYDFFSNKKIISDELILQQRASINFWRKYFYKLPKKIARIVFSYWKSPLNLLNTLTPFLSKKSKPIIKYSVKNKNFYTQFYKNLKYIKIIKKYWIKYKNNIIDIITNSNINKHIYNTKLINIWINIIDLWSLTKNNNNYYPKELYRFSQKTLISKTNKNIKIPKYILFKYIDIFLKKFINIKFLIIIKAIKYINQYIKKKKEINHVMSFNDLLVILNKGLNSKFGIKIAQDIRKLFPVILVDEFQDTDIQQYNILKKIYFNKLNNIMILIGDPKQAIYSFREADIFTYLKASFEIKNCYTLKNNWRSSSTMVNSINKLFSNRSYPFLFKNIVFHPINYTIKKLNYNFIVNNKIKPGITFWFINKILDINLYKQKMAYTCAYKICKLIILGEKNKAFLQKNFKNKKINISDITILVRNRFEASILQKEFIKFNLPSVYLSNSDNIFEKQEAKELVLLLKTILNPYKRQKIINFLSSTLFNINWFFLQDDKKDFYIEKIINKFINYKLIWEKQGILNMLEKIFIKDTFFYKINIINNFTEKKIKNILYLGELIQKSCINIINCNQVVEWLLQQIIYTDKNILNQQIKSNFYNNKKIKIMTIHKSKGLQFPIIWLPFISSNIIEFINKDAIFYHDRKNFKLILDFKKDKESKKFFLEESLAENLRLLYVSLTRSIFHCSIGISNLKIFNLKKLNLYIKYFNALDFLLKKKNDISNIEFKKILDNLKNKDIFIKIIKKNDLLKINNKSLKKKKNKLLFTSQINNFFYKNKVIFSFSKIKNQQTNNISYLTNNLKYKFLNTNEKKIKKTQYNFPCGKQIGITLHSILEKIDFTKKISRKFIKQELIKKNINSIWHIMITNWFNNIIKTPIGNKKIILNKINNKNKKTEFKFYLSIKNLFSSIKYNYIINKYDLNSFKLPTLKFEMIEGFLSGIIDLIFLWEKKYYILDYKSNWLGNSYIDYRKKYIENDICLNRYDIQYQIYSLALHKYLKYRISNYSYDKYFGGVIYLYIRGINNKENKNGIWETKPSFQLINELNKLFI
ncbi:exodeoxyribonuclease V subunit beta [Enterobacteriaceae endosymbiont of Donacia thalassina]|uniref:exodeoxyribonuclease V subunit beta n=1 Tax=Enterobacteriaceae endosymbiont of Donacia thalassina TaxID=2675786 RepID=UPI001449F990|nr:exodeoxyribonuclease V subunit beta [Enterobacteriaceae endosymbiont of Donacia thalassina]QJC37499.1 exodeoxyribonuclease V subunit beta [Enterobacteriaceae endosymbiont of Donacia thalassina]